MFKKLLVALIAFTAIGGTMSAFAWWDNLEQEQSETLTIGEGTNLVLTETVQAPVGHTLVPAGSVLKLNDVESITLEYTVNLDQTALTALNLGVVADNVLIGTTADATNIVDIDITLGNTTVNNNTVTVTVVITLDETKIPDQVTYDAVANEAITFDLTFTATQQ
jgi:hypothetical protein